MSRPAARMPSIASTKSVDGRTLPCSVPQRPSGYERRRYHGCPSRVVPLSVRRRRHLYRRCCRIMSAYCFMPRFSSSSTKTGHGGMLLRYGVAHAPVYIPPPGPVESPPPGPVESPPPGPMERPPPGPVERPPPGPVESPPPGPVDIPPPGPVERPPPGPVEAPPPGPVDIPPPGPVYRPPPGPMYWSLGHVWRGIILPLLCSMPNAGAHRPGPAGATGLCAAEGRPGSGEAPGSATISGP